MIDELKKYGKVKEDVDLKNYNTYKVPGTAKYLIHVKSEELLIELLDFLQSKKIKYFIIGNGSNIVLPEDSFDGVIIKLTELNKIDIDDDEVYVEAGVMMPKLVNETVDNCLTGLEWASGIPGTVGGSVIGNAGAYLSEIFDFIISIRILKNGKIEELSKDDVEHSYRHTSLKGKKDIIVLGVRLKLNKGNSDESRTIMKQRMERRISSQPLEYPSAGSTFRNPEGDYAGRLIEECGLKGKTIGGAMVSEKHANFIINYNNATSSDIRNLIKLVHDDVLENTGVDLILEQELLEWM